METPIIADRNSVLDACTQVVRKLRNLPGLRLLEEEDFIRLVYRRNQEVDPNLDMQGRERGFQNIALNIYAEAIFAAASCAENKALQEDSFAELSRYLYRMAFNFYVHQSLPPDEMTERAQECTQTALGKIYSHLSTVQEPGGFLKWCSVILRNVCLEEARSRAKDIHYDQEDIDLEIRVEDSHPDLDLTHDQRCLSAAISRLKAGYQEVIRLTYFAVDELGNKLTDEKIAATLQITTGYLYTIRSRSLSALKKDTQLLDCLQGNL